MKTIDYERYIFRLIKQEHDKGFESFVERLQYQVQRCQFSDPETQIRNQIVENTSMSDLRKKSFENRLSLKQLIFTGKTIELARLIGSGSDHRSVARKSDSTKKKECSRCGFDDHLYNDLDCPAMKVTCQNCKKL